MCSQRNIFLCSLISSAAFFRQVFPVYFSNSKQNNVYDSNLLSYILTFILKGTDWVFQTKFFSRPLGPSTYLAHNVRRIIFNIHCTFHNNSSPVSVKFIENESEGRLHIFYKMTAHSKLNGSVFLNYIIITYGMIA